MQRCREGRRLHYRDSPAGFDEVHLIKPADLIRYADAFIELDQVRAHTKQDVLAVVDNFPGTRMLVGGGASAEEGALLEKRDTETSVRECTGGGETGETAPGDGD